MIRAFNQAVKFLEKYIPAPEKKHPGELGLDRMKFFMKLLGNPQLEYPTIHVGGTSGKGSTATFIASILSTKYKVGLHTSPHLIKVNERIKILNNFQFLISNFQSISNFQLLNKIKTWWEKTSIRNSEFVQLLNIIVPCIKKMEKTRFGTPSYFEITTAMAFLYFQMKKVDIAVIEVGMGGRFDATNIIIPLVAVITNVGLDHTEVLGSTVEEIAIDKAGIIKEGVDVVSGVHQSSIIRIIGLKCKEKKARLSLLKYWSALSIPPPRGNPRLTRLPPGVSYWPFNYRIKNISSEGNVFDYYGDNNYRNLKIKLLGAHQVENAALAVRAIEISRGLLAISARGPLIKNIKEKDIRLGLLSAFIPGRLEIVRNQPLVILDGAHNPDKMEALTRSIKTLFPKKKVTVVLAIKKEKKAREMLKLLLTIADQIILTQYKVMGDIGIIDSYDSTDLLRIFTDINNKIHVKVIKNPVEALKTAITESEEDSLILVTGSLYLIGKILRNSKLKIQRSQPKAGPPRAEKLQLKTKIL